MKITTLSIAVSLTFSQATHAQNTNATDNGIALPVLQPYTVDTQAIPDSENIIIDTTAVANNTALNDTALDLTNDTQGIVIENIDNALNEVIVEPNGLNNTPSTTTDTGYYTPINDSEIALLLSDNASYVSWQGLNNRLRSPKEVRELYEYMAYQPLWTDNGYITTLGGSVIKATKDAWTHALVPEVYHTQATSSLLAGQQVAEPAKFDIILTDAFITLKKHLANGVVNPKRQFKTWNHRPEMLNFLKLYQHAADKGSATSILRVNNKDYNTLRNRYVALKSGNQKPSPELTPIPAKSLKPGQKNDAVLVLRKRLNLATDSNVYDKTVRNAVRDYQKNHGLGADGIAGRKTIRHMNGGATNTGSDNPEKVAINMERMRWQRPLPSGNYVWVNIPAYKMAIRNGNDFVFESNVVVGRSKRQTPVFRDTLEYVVLAPYWNVPSTIFKEDKLPKLQKNPSALGKNMQVVEKASGKVVAASSVNWKAGGKGYRLRELPGPKNSLGRMKFMFPNNHAIYLHDTPSRSLFKKNERAFSSGCVRVERAEDLSVFLLEDMGYNRDRIKKESRKTKEKWLKLEQNKRYPVFLDYYTTWVDSSGKVRYTNDVYGYDKPLKTMYKDALKKL